MAHAWDRPLFVIPTDPAGVSINPDGPLTVALYARDLSLLANVLGVQPPPPGATQLRYTIDTYPQLPARTQRSWLESTFMVDYEEPEVASLRSELIAATGEQPTREQLVDFLSRAVKNSYAHAWDIASVAARKREGDCSEYAVLTAALARSVGIPARVVIGAALTREGAHFAAYGHAWAELRVGERWAIADAALAAAHVPVRYVPFGLIEDEGPGFGIELARFTPVWLQRVDVLDGASPESD